jgi:hypothetical protein
VSMTSTRVVRGDHGASSGLLSAAVINENAAGPGSRRAPNCHCMRRTVSWRAARVPAIRRWSPAMRARPACVHGAIALGGARDIHCLRARTSASPFTAADLARWAVP